MEKLSKSYITQKKNDLCVKICRSLYRSVHGVVLSRKYQKEVADMKDPTLTFGEIVPQSFIQILGFVSRQSTTEDRVFVDLGSGTGRACICAALSPYGFSKVLGIELMPDLCEQSNVVYHKLLELLQQGENGKHHTSNSHTPPIKSKDSIDFDSAALKAMKELIKSDHSVKVDFFANILTKELGHKVFKRELKEHKSFMRYLKSRPEYFIVSEDGKILSLSESSQIEQGITVESQDTVEMSKSSVGEDSLDVADSSPPQADYQLTTQDVKLIGPLPSISFHCGDMFEYDWWTSADVVYAASLLFSESMMERLTEQASRMRPGGWVISLKPLLVDMDPSRLSGRIELKAESFYKMSWQMAKVYLYQIV